MEQIDSLLSEYSDNKQRIDAVLKNKEKWKKVTFSKAQKQLENIYQNFRIDMKNLNQMVETESVEIEKSKEAILNCNETIIHGMVQELVKNYDEKQKSAVSRFVDEVKGLLRRQMYFPQKQQTVCIKLDAEVQVKVV